MINRDNRHRKSEKEEDEELLKEEDAEDEAFVFEDGPPCKWNCNSRRLSSKETGSDTLL